MRNLKQYPITTEECIDHIKKYGEAEMERGLIGGTGPYVTKLVTEFLTDNKEFHSFIESKKH